MKTYVICMSRLNAGLELAAVIDLVDTALGREKSLEMIRRVYDERLVDETIYAIVERFSFEGMLLAALHKAGGKLSLDPDAVRETKGHMIIEIDEASIEIVGYDERGCDEPE